MPLYKARIIPRAPSRKVQRPHTATVGCSRFRTAGDVFLARAEADSKSAARTQLQRIYQPPEFAIGKIKEATP